MHFVPSLRTIPPTAAHGHAPFAPRLAALAIVAAATSLTGCGGGDDSSSSGSSGGGASSLTFSAATPSAHNTTADPTTAKTSGNDARAADVFSSAPYCDVYFEDFAAANGKRYALQVYFRQSDRQPLHASLIEATTGAPNWVVFNSASGAPITGISVDASTRRLTFTNKVLAGSSGGITATIAGSVTFTKSSAAACGS